MNKENRLPFFVTAATARGAKHTLTLDLPIAKDLGVLVARFADDADAMANPPHVSVEAMLDIMTDRASLSIYKGPRSQDDNHVATLAWRTDEAGALLWQRETSGHVDGPDKGNPIDLIHVAGLRYLKLPVGFVYYLKRPAAE